MKLLLLFLIFNFLYFVSPVNAATPTPENKNQEIKDQLISNIASRVAQLNLVEKRGIIGKVTEATNTQITLADIRGDTRFVDVDELTKFSSPNAKGTFGISDITADATLGVLGLYNKESRRLLARFVKVITAPTIIHGGVAAVDSKNFSLNVATDNGKQLTVDVENITKTYSYTHESGYVRSGFSRIEENYSIIAAGALSKSEENRMTATRVIIFPEIPVSPNVNSALENTTKPNE